MTNEELAAIADYAAQVVASAPKIPEETRERISAIFANHESVRFFVCGGLVYK